MRRRSGLRIAAYEVCQAAARRSRGGTGVDEHIATEATLPRSKADLFRAVRAGLVFGDRAGCPCHGVNRSDCSLVRELSQAPLLMFQCGGIFRRDEVTIP